MTNAGALCFSPARAWSCRGERSGSVMSFFGLSCGKKKERGELSDGAGKLPWGTFHKAGLLS